MQRNEINTLKSCVNLFIYTRLFLEGYKYL